MRTLQQKSHAELGAKNFGATTEHDESDISVRGNSAASGVGIVAVVFLRVKITAREFRKEIFVSAAEIFHFEKEDGRISPTDSVRACPNIDVDYRT